MPTSKTKKKPTRRVRQTKLISRPNRKKEIKIPKKETKEKAITYARLPNVVKLTKSSWDILWINRKLFIGIGLIYGLLNLILVQGLASSSEIDALKNSLSNVAHGNFGSIFSGLSIFIVLLGSAGNGTSQTAGAYQLFLAIITSLAVIWALRQLINNKKIRIRDTFYLGMAPLIPFILVLIVIALELLPLLIGSLLYSIVLSNSIVIGWIEQVIALIVFLLLASLTIYWILGSMFALYIVTLPNMSPIKALKSANKLVKKRRLLILRKLLFLPFILIVAAAIIMLPIVIIISGVAQWVFFILTMFVLIIIHSYIYNLYRELLNET